MESLGFKFTFYKRPVEEQQVSEEDKITKKSNTNRHPSQPRPVLAQIVNHSNFRVTRPSTQRNSRGKPRPFSICKISATPVVNDISRSKSHIKQPKNEAHSEVSYFKHPHSYNIIKLIPVLHHYKRSRGLKEYMDKAFKQHFDNGL